MFYCIIASINANCMKICEDDIECHSYEEISTEPAMKIENTQNDPMVHAVITEMAAFRADFSAVVQDSTVKNDLSSFWLRKTKKPVLAVLLVQKPGQKFKLYRGAKNTYFRTSYLRSCLYYTVGNWIYSVQYFSPLFL